MRRALSVLLSLLLVFTCLSALADGPELLTNGSFEELDGEGLPVGWSTDAYIMA